MSKYFSWCCCAKEDDSAQKVPVSQEMQTMNPRQAPEGGQSGPDEQLLPRNTNLVDQTVHEEQEHEIEVEENISKEVKSEERKVDSSHDTSEITKQS